MLVGICAQQTPCDRMGEAGRKKEEQCGYGMVESECDYILMKDAARREIYVWFS